MARARKEDTADEDIVIPAGTVGQPWHALIEVKENSKVELLWLHKELKRIGVSRLSDLEALIAKAQ